MSTLAASAARRKDDEDLLELAIDFRHLARRAPRRLAAGVPVTWMVSVWLTPMPASAALDWNCVLSEVP
jgi:hypothetical protein